MVQGYEEQKRQYSGCDRLFSLIIVIATLGKSYFPLLSTRSPLPPCPLAHSRVRGHLFPLATLITQVLLNALASIDARSLVGIVSYPLGNDGTAPLLVPIDGSCDCLLYGSAGFI